MINPQIKELAARYFHETVFYRQHIHRHPELSFSESETAAFVSSRLKEFGIPHKKEVGGHGIIALIEGRNPSDKCTALRADMDALPIQEISTKSYCSVNDGVMHACGHDVHTAMLLSAGRILQEMRQHFNGTVKLIFQPAEEKLPGGAVEIIRAGGLENPGPDQIIGQHVLPTLESGKVGFRSGAFMASGDEINIRVIGKGGHAAMPEKINDTVLIASQIVVNLQQVVSRFASPLIPTVLSFGKIVANGAHNVIPSEVLIQGTFRTFDETWRAKAKEHIIRIAQQTAAAGGAKAEVMIEQGYPFLWNDEVTTRTAKLAAIEYLGKENVIDLDQRMTTEDFAWYSQQLPACFYRIGTRNESQHITSDLHTATFDIDENILETGTGLMAYIALKQLSNL
ncbi:MAG: amidohydrolase [Bacteroidales bacterium]|nr:amidohydrolase [Bacteroidales bacterium]